MWCQTGLTMTQGGPTKYDRLEMDETALPTRAASPQRRFWVSIEPCAEVEMGVWSMVGCGMPYFAHLVGYDRHATPGCCVCNSASRVFCAWVPSWKCAMQMQFFRPQQCSPTKPPTEVLMLGPHARAAHLWRCTLYGLFPTLEAGEGGGVGLQSKMSGSMDDFVGRSRRLLRLNRVCGALRNSEGGAGGQKPIPRWCIANGRCPLRPVTVM